MRPSLDQASGSESTNLQAGRDIIYQTGPSLSEVREIAIDVFRANFLDLGATTREIVDARVEDLLTEYLRRVEHSGQEALRNTTDPDIRRTLYNAQAEYACSGEEQLRSLLVALLVERTEDLVRDTRALALNEAVVCAPRLTAGQRAALAVAFYVRHTRYTGQPDLNVFFANLAASLSPFADSLPRKASDYQHLCSVGAASAGTNMASHRFSELFRATAPRFFTTGVSRDNLGAIAAAASFIDDTRVFMPGLREPANSQLALDGPDEIQDFADLVGGSEDLVASLINIDQLGLMSADAIRGDIVSRVPILRSLIDTWDEFSIQHLDLTSTGIAIGHTIWQEATGSTASLEIWL